MVLVDSNILAYVMIEGDQTDRTHELYLHLIPNAPVGVRDGQQLAVAHLGNHFQRLVDAPGILATKSAVAASRDLTATMKFRTQPTRKPSFQSFPQLS